MSKKNITFKGCRTLVCRILAFIVDSVQELCDMVNTFKLIRIKSTVES